MLVDAHVFGAPFGEVGAVADVVAPTEVDGDETLQRIGGGGGEVEKGVGGERLEEGKVP